MWYHAKLGGEISDSDIPLTPHATAEGKFAKIVVHRDLPSGESTKGSNANDQRNRDSEMQLEAGQEPLTPMTMSIALLVAVTWVKFIHKDEVSVLKKLQCVF